MGVQSAQRVDSGQGRPGRPFVCILASCDKDFAEKRYLDQHLFKVHKINPHLCGETGCGRRFRTKMELYHHQDTVHQEGMPNSQNTLASVEKTTSMETGDVTL